MKPELENSFKLILDSIKTEQFTKKDLQFISKFSKKLYDATEKMLSKAMDDSTT